MWLFVPIDFTFCELVNSWTHITTNNITKWKIIMQGWQNNLIKLLYNIYYYNNIYYIIINMWIFLIFGNWFCYVVSCYVGRFCMTPLPTYRRRIQTHVGINWMIIIESKWKRVAIKREWRKLCGRSNLFA